MMNFDLAVMAVLGQVPRRAKRCRYTYTILGYSRKKSRVVEGHTFLKTPLEFLGFLLLPMEIPDKARPHLQKLHKIVLHPLKILRPKTKTLGEVPHDFFLITPGNSPLFLINPGKYMCYFFNTNGLSFLLNSPLLICCKQL